MNTDSSQKISVTKINDEVFRRLVDAVADYAIFVMDKNGIILTWNKGAERMKGYQAHEIIGKSFKLFYTPDNILRNHPDHELQIAEREGRYEEEGWRIKKDGRRFWASVLITRLNDADGSFIGFSKITRDLTERKEAEEKLRNSEERFRTLVNNVEDYAIITLDLDGRVTSWNAGAEKIKGFRADEIIGQHFRTFYSEEDRAAGKPERELFECRNKGRFEDEGWRVRKDGSRFWANVIVTALRNSSGEITAFSKITRDLTERMQSEEALRLTNASLEEKVSHRTAELERALSAKDQFLSIASHELNTPLTTLKMQIQIRLKKLQSENEILDREVLKKMYGDDLRQINRLVTLVEDILEISRINTGKFLLKKKEVDLCDVAKTIAAQFAPQFERANVQLDLILPTVKLVGVWDAFRIEQVISNLLSNAFKYGSGNPVKIVLEKQEDIAVLKIIDQGIGIQAHDRERIFGQFERAIAASEISGMGLGLYISKQIIDAHNGTIKVESALGKGSTFTVCLPLEN